MNHSMGGVLSCPAPDRDALDRAFQVLRRRWPACAPVAGLILGSGWGEGIDAFQVRDAMPYGDLPGMGTTGVTGHAGRLAWAEYAGVPTLVFQGRRHFYEGEGWTPVALPIYLLRRLGARGVFLTNAAGGITEGMRAGDLMIVRDHLNLMGGNPLIGPCDPVWGSRFPDQTNLYDAGLRAAMRAAAARAGVPVREGVYAAVSGPAYETPAEVRAFGRLGADAVGMSTAPEAMLANAAGLRVAAVSCISNLAAGISATPLSHEDVAAAARAALPRMRALIAEFWSVWTDDAKGSGA